MVGSVPLKRGILLVTAASAVDTALSFLMPLLLSRLVPVEEFGQYRLFWLVVTTLAAFAPLGLEQALIYFLVRNQDERRLRVVGNTLIYFNVVAAVGAVLVLPWNGYLSARLDLQSQLVLGGFTLLYLSSLPLDYLPLANNRTTRHAVNVLICSVVRVASVLLPAWYAGHIVAAFFGLLLFTVIRLALLSGYLLQEYRAIVLPADVVMLRSQLAYGVPFGIAAACYTFRLQAEQWLVSAMYTMREFAVFSVALLVVPVLQVLQQPLARVLQPRIHQHAVSGRLEQAHALNVRANVTVGFLVYPLIIFLFVFADDIIGVAFPESYAAAASVMRVYLLAQFRLALEGSSLLQALGEGQFAMRLAVVLLPVVVLISGYGAANAGMVAAASGSVTVMWIEMLLIQRRLAHRLGVSFGAVQAWVGHARLLVMAVMANLAALGLARLLPAGSATLISLGVTFSAMLLAYLVLAIPLGMASLLRDLVFWRTFGASGDKLSGARE